MSSAWPYLLVGLGGFLGANARFLLGALIGAPAPGRFPVATFLVNISGSFLLGLLGGLLANRAAPAAPAVQLALGVGFLGAFTTFSTFELEAHTLIDRGAWWMAAAYMTASVLAGLVALRAGLALARSWPA